MSRFLIHILTISATVLIIIFGIGIRMGPEIDTELSFLLPEAETFVFDMYTNILKYPDTKRNLETVEILESGPSQVTKWRENYQNNSWREYKVLGKYSPYYFDYEIYRSRFKTNSKISVAFQETGGFTKVLMTEKGKIDNVFFRGLNYLIGDNHYLKSEAKWLRVAILQNQIQRK